MKRKRKPKKPRFTIRVSEFIRRNKPIRISPELVRSAVGIGLVNVCDMGEGGKLGTVYVLTKKGLWSLAERGVITPRQYEAMREQYRFPNPTPR